MNTLHPPIEDQKNFLESILAAKTNEEVKALRIDFASRFPESGGWPKPLPLAAKVSPEPYPLDALPKKIRGAAEEVHAFVKSPVPMVASCALSAVSLATQAHVDVKRAENLSGPTSLFFLTIAESGERKTTCDSFFMQEIRKYEDVQREIAKPKLEEYRAKSGAWEAKRNGLLDSIRKAEAKGQDSSCEENGLRDHESKKPAPPRVPRLIYGDVTPEKLASDLASKWPSGGIVSSEAGAVFGSHGMNRDNAMKTLSLYNGLWDGVRQTVDRKTTDSVSVKGARLTLGLQVQERPLREFLNRSGELARGIGFFARCLFAWPDSTQGTRSFEEAPANWPGLEAFNRRISDLLNGMTIPEDGSLTPSVLALLPDAKAAWIVFYNAIEGELKNGGELQDVSDIASKAADNAARLAALFQVFDNGSGAAISKDAFVGASRVVGWHLNEARRFFGELAMPDELANAVRLDGWLIEYCRREKSLCVPRRKVQQFGPRSLREGAKLDAALKILVEAYRTRETKKGRQKEIEINPHLLSGGRE